MSTSRTLLSILLALGACASTGTGGGAVEVADVTVLVRTTNSSGMDALGRGRVAAVGGCLGWEHERGPVLVVWPAGTVVVGRDPVRVQVPGVGEVGLGDEVVLGGGTVWEPTSGGEYPTEVDGVVLPAACRHLTLFVASPG